jgi:hypothetical protein
LGKVRALYDFAGETEQDLPLREGDLVVVLAEDPSGWWTGECNGRVGIFPSNWCEKITNTGQETCIALYDCIPTQLGDLGFVVGDVITVLEKDEVSGTNKQSHLFFSNLSHNNVSPHLRLVAWSQS